MNPAPAERPDDDRPRSDQTLPDLLLGLHLLQRRVGMRMHTYAEAGTELNIPASWLEKRKDELPHTQFGAHVRFSDADLDEIREMHRVRPAAVGAPVTGLPGILLDLKPAGERYRAAGSC